MKWKQARLAGPNYNKSIPFFAISLTLCDLMMGITSIFFREFYNY